jgi:diguanylate cyclase (GGDEF)-like protein
MSSAPKNQLYPASDVAVRQASRRWLLAGIAGMTFAVAVAFSGIFSKLSPALAATLTIACGWLMMLVLSPWRNMRELYKPERDAIQELNIRLRMIADGNRNIPLKDLLIERDDDLGALSRVVHDMACEAVGARKQVTLAQRRIDDDVQKQTKRATAHLERQAATDPLTGLGNRRALDQRLTELSSSFPASGRLITVAALDFDSFKSINDSFGHEAGDRCLVFLADLLRTSLRKDDCAIRLGGDEFMLLMPDQSVAAAKAAANRIASLFAQLPWTEQAAKGVSRPTLSFGIASERVTSAAMLEALMRQADAALYASKQAGKSKVTVYSAKRVAA